VGKTSTARILAKALNCVRGPTSKPCSECEICQSIASGEDVDVLEIDGASNRGIDEIREIRQNAQYRPGRARYKIYIVDEVHMLTAPAFNALLKTLEEPPAHVKFIFATTEAQKIPVTILSRCQRFDFAGIGTARIVQRLRDVVDAEDRHAEEEALELVARRAGGSMRDAQSLLDQLLAFGGEVLTTDQVHQLLGTAQDERVLALAAAVLGHDRRQTLALLQQAAREGLQLGELLDQFLEYWRDLMVVHCAGIEGQDLSVPARHRQTLLQQSTGAKLDTLLAGLEVLAATKARLRGSSHPRVLVEMALIRLAGLEDLVSLTQLAESLTSTAEKPIAPARTSTLSQRDSGEAQVPIQGVKKKAVTAPETPALIGLKPETLPEIWLKVMQQVGQMLASDLGKAGLPAIFGPNTLVLRFPTGYNSEREHCQQAANLGRIEVLLRKVTGEPLTLRIESAGKEGGQAPVRPVDEKADQPSRYRRQRADAVKEPVVKRAIDRLGAQLIDVDEGFGGSADPAAVPSDVGEAEEA
jgi:DNA polymerase-3 subunit gamma/tau